MYVRSLRNTLAREGVTRCNANQLVAPHALPNELILTDKLIHHPRTSSCKGMFIHGLFLSVDLLHVRIHAREACAYDPFGKGGQPAFRLEFERVGTPDCHRSVRNQQSSKRSSKQCRSSPKLNFNHGEQLTFLQGYGPRGFPDHPSPRLVLTTE